MHSSSVGRWLDQLTVSLWFKVSSPDAGYALAEVWAVRFEREVMEPMLAVTSPSIIPVPDELVGADGIEPTLAPAVSRQLTKWSKGGSVVGRQLRGSSQSRV